jgi:crotonobetainyl-CoA:carnitine CoA-transferase CaiB-like acyl-CoA transferase
MTGERMLLGDLRVLELGEALAGSVCGRLFAELGAEVLQIRLPSNARPTETTEARHVRRVTDALKHEVDASRLAELASEADLIIAGGAPGDLEGVGWTPEALRALAPGAVVVTITPFGWTGPYRDYRATDLTTFHTSGLSRLLLGSVDDPLVEPPVRAAGEQTEFIAGIAASTASMAALHRRARTGEEATIDVSAHEAMACMAARELSSPALGVVPSSRTRRGDVLGASVVLPASDGYVSISPRETHQWAAWVEVMGAPAWTADARFATNADRLQRADELIPLMSEWSRSRTRAEIYAATQEAHVPCFPVNSAAEVFEDEHFRERGSFMPLFGSDGKLAPAPPFGLPTGSLRSEPPAGEFSNGVALASDAPSASGELPLAGVRVLDFSWVIAGPTTTQFLASFGAEIVKIESPTRPDPGRRTALHDVLGRSKLNLGLDLKAPGAVDAVLKLAATSDVVLENFARGVMERLGLGEERLREVNPEIVYVSSAGLGRTGPQADAVAYGTLVQCFVAFADLNGFPDRPPSPGFAWSDPLCGMLLAFSSIACLFAREAHDGTAALYARQQETSAVRKIDHSMAEALLWTMPGSLLEAQEGLELPRQLGNRSRDFVPHDLYPAAGDDQWIAIAVTSDKEWRALCGEVEGLAELAELDGAARLGRRGEIDGVIAGWTATRDAREAMHALQGAGVAAGATFDTQTLFEDEHLWARGFYQPVTLPDGETQLLPGLPWKWADGTRTATAATGLGSDNEEVLGRIAGLSPREIEALRGAGAFGVGAEAAVSQGRA